MSSTSSSQHGGDPLEVIKREITSTQEHVDQARFRLDTLERRLKLKKMPGEERERLEAELEDIKAVLAEQEEALKELQSYGRGTPQLAALVFMATFAAYLIYTVFTNPY